MSAIELYNAAADVAPAVTLHAQGGVLGFIQTKAGEVETLIKVVGSVFAVGFVVYKAVKSAFAVGTIVITMLMAGAFVWGLYNVDLVQQKVNEEVTGTGPMSDAFESVSLE